MRGERSASERERARWEREVRRAQREGREPPPPPTDLSSAPGAAAERPRATAPPPAAPEIERPHAPPPAAPEAERPPVAPPPRPVPPPAVPREPEPLPPVTPLRPPRPVPPADDPPPAARRTVRLPRAAHSPDEEPLGVKRYEPQPGAPGLSPNRPVPPRSPRRRRAGPRVTAGVALLAVVFAGYLAIRLFQPFHGEPGGAVAVTIPEGAGATQIGQVLERGGVVDSATLFALRARLSGGDGLRSGPHRLRRDMSYAAALAALRRAPEAAPVVDVTLPEGPSIRENAARVRQAGVEGDYRAAAAAARAQARRLGLPRRVRTVEGFLFPATFELRRPAASEDLVARQLEAFREQTAEIDFRRARRANLTRYDVLIIASMVEREALVPRERRIVAGVVYNRLRQGIPLGIDATIRYDLNNWSRPLRVSELERDSPYNTRKRRGLPPTPIGNPGLASIRAAADPARHDYLFYVVKPCGKGAHAFSKTDAQFQRDVRAYNRARDARGGRDPSRC